MIETIFNNAEEVNFKVLSEMAKNNDIDLNNKPLHAGAYEYNFSIEGWNFSFVSDGTTWKWEYSQVNQ